MGVIRNANCDSCVLVPVFVAILAEEDGRELLVHLIDKCRQAMLTWWVSKLDSRLADVVRCTCNMVLYEIIHHLHPTCYMLYPASYILHPTSYIPHPILGHSTCYMLNSDILHHDMLVLHILPWTLYLIHATCPSLHPSSNARRRCCLHNGFRHAGMPDDTLEKLVDTCNTPTWCSPMLFTP